MHTLPAAIVQDQLERILRSQAFAEAPTLRRLLQYVLTHTLDGERELKEYTIGVDVFNRGPDFDPRIDTIVRVQARRRQVWAVDRAEIFGLGFALT